MINRFTKQRGSWLWVSIGTKGHSSPRGTHIYDWSLKTLENTAAESNWIHFPFVLWQYRDLYKIRTRCDIFSLDLSCLVHRWVQIFSFFFLYHWYEGYSNRTASSQVSLFYRTIFSNVTYLTTTILNSSSSESTLIYAIHHHKWIPFSIPLPWVALGTCNRWAVT